jgi:signal recognition particle GTPase
VQQVNQLLQQHRQMKKMMKQVAAGGTPALGAAPGAQRPRAAGSRSNRKKRRR